jgi:hypothetical protein
MSKVRNITEFGRNQRCTKKPKMIFGEGGAGSGLRFLPFSGKEEIHLQSAIFFTRATITNMESTQCGR